jgi:hypothetical protein
MFSKENKTMEDNLHFWILFFSPSNKTLSFWVASAVAFKQYYSPLSQNERNNRIRSMGVPTKWFTIGFIAPTSSVQSWCAARDLKFFFQAVHQTTEREILSLIMFKSLIL